MASAVIRRVVICRMRRGAVVVRTATNSRFGMCKADRKAGSLSGNTVVAKDTGANADDDKSGYWGVRPAGILYDGAYEFGGKLPEGEAVLDGHGSIYIMYA